MEQVSPISPSSSTTTIHRQREQQSSALLKGVLILTITKPIRVASLAVTLNGSSHLALSRTSSTRSTQPVDKRIAHYSRQHLRVQQFLIEPSPDPDQFTTIIPPSTSSASIHTDDGSNRESSYSLSNNQIAYPFAIRVPHDIPASVTTPHGGTIYRLNAELTMAKPRGSTSGIKALLSAAVGGTAVYSAVTTVNIYRAGFLRHPPRSIATRHRASSDANDTEREPHSNNRLTISRPQTAIAGDAAQRVVDSSLIPSSHHICAAHTVSEEAGSLDSDDSDNDEGAMVPDSIHHIWPDHLETTVLVPYVQLPPKSHPDFKVQVKLLGSSNVSVKAFQASLNERVIFRVAKTINMEKRGLGKQTTMSIVGIRERAVSTQRMQEGWQLASGSTQIDKVCQFTTPNTVRESNELYSSRICNTSTYGRISKSALRNLKEDEEETSVSPSEIEYGDIDIEIQHFLRFTLLLSGPSSTASDKQPIERHLGDIPVVIRGVPGEVKCDSTGLPSYLDSFSTSTPSQDEERTYEAATRASLSVEHMSGSDGESIGGRRDSMLSLGSLLGLRPSGEDLENDDAFMAIMGLRGSRTPPRYEDSIGRPSLDTISTIGTINDIPPQSSVLPATDHANDMHGDHSSSIALCLTR
ncbi:hypothetical protein B0O80DRAFT_434943 [Mortierella sp. GBAus27b]|nr:hypothetical protein B0O80DRAFT_434943 [Mortierella sp. GBAus27b]